MRTRSDTPPAWRLLSAAAAAFERALEIDPEMREAYYGTRFHSKVKSCGSPHSSVSICVSNQYKKEAQDDLAKGGLNSAKNKLLRVLAADENDG